MTPISEIWVMIVLVGVDICPSCHQHCPLYNSRFARLLRNQARLLPPHPVHLLPVPLCPVGIPSLHLSCPYLSSRGSAVSPDGLQSEHSDHRYLAVGKVRLGVGDVVGMGVALMFSYTPVQMNTSIHREVRQAVNTSALLFPLPGPVHSATGAGASWRMREDPATGPF